MCIRDSRKAAMQADAPPAPSSSGLMCTEMVSAKAVLYNNKNTEDLMKTVPGAVSYTHLDNDEQALINRIIEGRKKGKKYHLIINAEGIGHSTGMARRIEACLLYTSRCV